MRSPQAAVPAAKPRENAAAQPKSPLHDFGVSAAIAAPLLAFALFILPLRLGEVLQIAGVTGVAHTGLFNWIART
ncbi:MAG: hypothetical protein ACRD4O_19570, partial [Bryobacteraceae bacterium]